MKVKHHSQLLKTRLLNHHFCTTKVTYWKRRTKIANQKN